MRTLVVLIIIGAAVAAGGILAIILVSRRLLQQLKNSLPLAVLGRLKREMSSGELAQRLSQPISLSGMDAVYRPQIQADFPELNIDEWMIRAERLAVSTLSAIDAGDVSLLGEPGDLYASQIRRYMADLKDQGRQEHYSNIKVHKTVISNYLKSAGTCRMDFQLAAEADYEKTGPDGLPSGRDDSLLLIKSGRPTQFKFEIEALYVQNPDDLASHDLDALAFNCPNCGAPISSLGDRRCSHCGSAVEPMNIRVWAFAGFRRLAP
jgi:hypothetical protein